MIGWDDLVTLEHALDIVYRRGAKFMIHDQTIAALKKIKDWAAESGNIRLPR